MGNKYTLHEDEIEKEDKLINKLTNKKEVKKLYSGKRKSYVRTEGRSTTHKKQLLNNLCTSTLKTEYKYMYISICIHMNRCIYMFIDIQMNY